MDGKGRVDLEFGTMGDGKNEGVKGLRVERADIQGAEGMKGGVVQGEEKRRDGTGDAREMHFR